VAGCLGISSERYVRGHTMEVSPPRLMISWNKLFPYQPTTFGTPRQARRHGRTRSHLLQQPELSLNLLFLPNSLRSPTPSHHFQTSNHLYLLNNPLYLVLNLNFNLLFLLLLHHGARHTALLHLHPLLPRTLPPSIRLYRQITDYHLSTLPSPTSCPNINKAEPTTKPQPSTPGPVGSPRPTTSTRWTILTKPTGPRDKKASSLTWASGNRRRRPSGRRGRGRRWKAGRTRGGRTS
jgi:hypothetical protein